MAVRDNLYSRVVIWLKVILPLVALALLSTLFLLARGVDTTQTLPFSERELRERLDASNVTAPFYSGVTDDGATVLVTADTARPDPQNEGKVDAKNLSVRYTLGDGERLNIRADHGLIDEPADKSELDGDVVITTSSGYVMTTDELTTGLKRVEGESKGPVAGTGPPGTLNAGKMTVRSDDVTGHVQLFFTDGVTLVYDPQDDTDP